MRAAVVLQARMGSTRLPGKVLEPIGTRTLLEHCVQRLQVADVPVVVATTTAERDLPIVAEATRLKVQVVRGQEDDVLARYCAAARALDLSVVVRATADNPFVDGEAVGRTLRLLQRAEADHVIECGLPLGTAVEAVTVDALNRAADSATDPYDREHVTSFIRRDSRFRALRAVATGAIRRPGLRLTVDTPDDLEFVRQIYADLGAPDTPVPLTSIIAAADARIVQSMARARVRGA